MVGEYGFLTDNPNAREAIVPSSIRFIAEDVLEGVRLAITTLNKSDPQERLGSRRRLELAASKLLKWFDDLPKANCRPFIMAEQSIIVYRLGKLLTGEYALYGSTAELRPAQKHHVNYVYYHQPPHHAEQSDTLAGLEYQKQIYLGYAPPSITNMDGYAISLNQLLTLEAQQIARLDAEQASDIQIPYYLGFPGLSPV